MNIYILWGIFLIISFIFIFLSIFKKDMIYKYCMMAAIIFLNIFNLLIQLGGAK